MFEFYFITTFFPFNQVSITFSPSNITKSAFLPISILPISFSLPQEIAPLIVNALIASINGIF